MPFPISPKAEERLERAMALCRYNEPLTNAISLRQQERGVLLGDWRQIFVAEGVGLKGGWVLARGKEVGGIPPH